MMKSWIHAAPYLQVALGGALGAAARLGVNRAALAAFGPGPVSYTHLRAHET